MNEGPQPKLDPVFRDRLSNDAFEALSSWCEDTECSIEFLNWLSGGQSGAMLAEVFLTDERGLRKAVLKYCPSPSGRQGHSYLAHRNALRSAPKFAESHIVRLDPGIEKPIPAGTDGLFLVMEYRAQGYLGYTTMVSLLDRSVLGDACKTVVTQVLGKWNEVEGMPKRRPGGIRAQYFLKEVLGDRCEKGGSVRLAIEMLEASSSKPYVTSSGQELPSPLAAVISGANIEGVLLSGICGNAHGDLHEENILMPVLKKGRPSARDFNKFLLIDLSTFRNDRLLAVDPVNLLLSIVARRLPEISEHGRGRLADLIFDPDDAECGGVPAELVEAVQAIHKAGAQFAEGRCFFPEWRSETFAAIAACALLFVAWTKNDSDRRWFLLIAARAISVLGSIPSTPTVGAINRSVPVGTSDTGERAEVPPLTVVPQNGASTSPPGDTVIVEDKGKTCTDLTKELILEIRAYDDNLSPHDAVTATTIASVIVEELSIALDAMQRWHDVHKTELYLTYITSIGSAQVKLDEVSKVLGDIRERGTSSSALEEMSDAAELLLDAIQDIERIDHPGKPPDS